MGKKLLIGAGFGSIAAGLAHVAVIIGGPDWYRAFGAGEAMAQMAEAGDLYPALATLFITAVLFGWALYAFTGALARPIFLQRIALIAISTVLLIRGVYGMFIPLIGNPYESNVGTTFWVLSSSICIALGLCFALGTRFQWSQLSND